MFNILSQFYYPQANLKHQGSKNFFYGVDGVIEDNLSVIEGDLARIIGIVLETSQVPKKESEDHIDLLFFVALQTYEILLESKGLDIVSRNGIKNTRVG